MLEQSTFILVIRLLLIVLWFLTFIPIASIIKLFRLPGQYRVIIWVYLGLSYLMGIRIKTVGTPSTEAPTLYVSNHVSYLDIVVLGSLLKSYFIAKSEIKGWPVIGLLAQIQNTLFVERNRKHIRTQLNAMKAFFASKRRLTLFPEGTTTNGSEMLHFKSSLFDAANQDLRFPIQPITLIYGTSDGKDLGDANRHHYAWYGDDELAPHLLRLLSLKKRAEVVVVFHDCVYFHDFESREAVAKFCHQVVSSELCRRITVCSHSV